MLYSSVHWHCCSDLTIGSRIIFGFFSQWHIAAKNDLGNPWLFADLDGSWSSVAELI